MLPPLERSANRAAASQSPAGQPASNVIEMTVGELSGALKRTIEDRFGFVRVRGEISNYRGPHASGHAYFCLKDDAARIDAVVWRTAFARLKTPPQEGLEVIATGRITTFPGKSTYQIVIDTIEPAGIGALMAVLEARRKALAGEGLFDEGRKRPLPFLPRTIGVVTSPTGAVIRDILHRIEDRFPRHVLLWPVRVQGETAAAEVAAAIAGFDALPAGGTIARPDVLIVARGGGSLEDLWAFNEEVVIRAAAACTIPLVSAVGHETDWTLLDHVADLRAPTPSGAAEKAVPVRSDLLVQHSDLARRHLAGIVRIIAQRRGDVRALARALPGAEGMMLVPRQRLDRAETRLAAAVTATRDRRRLALIQLAHRLSSQAPRARLAARQHELATLAQRMDFCVRRDEERRRRAVSQSAQRLAGAAFALRRDLRRAAEARARTAAALKRLWEAALVERRTHLERAGRLLDSLSYRNVLARGFALIRDGDDRPVRGIGQAAVAATLDIEFVDGHIAAVVGSEGLRPAKAVAKARIEPAKTPRVKVEQGSLF